MNSRKGVSVVGELSDGKINLITTELLGIGRSLADKLEQELSVIFIGSEISEAANEAIFFGADKVYIIDAPVFEVYLTDPYVKALAKLSEQIKPEILLLGHTSLGMDLSPRLAFRLETGLTQDCVELSIDPETKLLQKTKPIYGGNALAMYVCEEGRPQMATIRAKVMEPSKRDVSRRGDIIFFNIALDEAAIRGKVLSTVKEEIGGIKIEDANVIICGGRGIGSFEGFQELEKLAEVLNGAVGATRPPCDAKWCPSYYQIGLTGKLVSPSLYIGIALSGSSQHQAGILGSKAIVAINKDPEANIFRIADYGIVGEYEKVLPSFLDKCNELLPKT